MPELAVTRTIHIQAALSAVWEALTEPELISEWFGDRTQLDVRVGGAGVLSWDEWGDFPLEVVQVEPERVFAFRWAREPDVAPVVGASTLVRFTLAERDGGVDVTVTETGWEELDGDVEAAMKGNTDGWHEELDELAALLERQDSV